MSTKGWGAGIGVGRAGNVKAHRRSAPNKGTLKYDATSFVAAVRKAHEDRSIGDRGYDWSRCIYKGNAVKVELSCPKEGHGPFQLLPTALWRGGGCPTCAAGRYGDHLRGDITTFLHDAKSKFGDKFEYDAASFDKLAAPMRIRCTAHDIWFVQRPCEHLRGCVLCSMCKDEKRRHRRIAATREMLGRCAQSHQGKYDYSKVPHDRQPRTAVPIGCPEHGEFKQTLEHHVKGHGCRRCGYATVGAKLRHSEEDLVARLRARWGKRSNST